MTLDYEGNHCKRCGKKIPWNYDSYCDECVKEAHLEEIRQSIKNGEPKTWSKDYIVCPYCGYALEPNLDDDVDFYYDGEHFVECEECGKEFVVNTSISYSWKTRQMEDN